MTIQKQINDILDRCHALNIRIEVSGSVWEGREQTALNEEIAALSASVGAGLHPGKEVTWPVGDGYARYIVGRVHTQTVKLYHIPLGDAWRSSAVDDQGLALRSIVEQRIKQEEGAIFGKGPFGEAS